MQSNREKKHGSPGKHERNTKGRLASARLRQLKKRTLRLSKQLKGI